MKRPVLTLILFLMLCALGGAMLWQSYRYDTDDASPRPQRRRPAVSTVRAVKAAPTDAVAGVAAADIVETDVTADEEEEIVVETEGTAGRDVEEPALSAVAVPVTDIVEEAALDGAILTGDVTVADLVTEDTVVTDVSGEVLDGETDESDASDRVDTSDRIDAADESVVGEMTHTADMSDEPDARDTADEPDRPALEMTPDSAHVAYREIANTRTVGMWRVMLRGLGRGAANVPTAPAELVRGFTYEFSSRPWYEAIGTSWLSGMGGTFGRMCAGMADVCTLGCCGDVTLAEGFPEYVWQGDWQAPPPGETHEVASTTLYIAAPSAPDVAVEYEQSPLASTGNEGDEE